MLFPSQEYDLLFIIMLNISGDSTCTPTKEVTSQDPPKVLTPVKKATNTAVNNSPSGQSATWPDTVELRFDDIEDKPPRCLQRSFESDETKWKVDSTGAKSSCSLYHQQGSFGPLKALQGSFRYCGQESCRNLALFERHRLTWPTLVLANTGAMTPC